MRKIIPVLVLLATGCGGESFSAFGARETDAGAVTEVDSGAGDSGGSVTTASGGSAVQETDSGTSSGGASTGGTLSATGGVTATGGTIGTGGTTSTGGTAACALVTHSNGIGQTWQDCVALGTWNESQATKACVTHTGDARHCYVSGGCGGVPLGIVRTDSSTDSYFWAYAGTLAGNVSDKGCVPDRVWN